MPTINTTERDTARQHLLDTHAAFHRLLAEIGDDAWERPIAGSAWNVREQACHVANNMSFLHDNELLRTRKERNAFKPPTFLLNFFNRLITGRGGRGQTMQQAAAIYDAGHEMFIATLAQIGDNEWQRGARNVLGEYRTVAGCFAHVAEHFADHEAQIRSALR